MGTHSIHVRLNDEEFAFISELAKELNCSNQAVIQKAIHDKNIDMEPIVEQYWKAKETEHLKQYFECTVDSSTMRLLENFGKEMKCQTQKMRDIGTKTDTLTKAIEKQKDLNRFSWEREKVNRRLEDISGCIDYILTKQKSIEETQAELVDSMQHVKFRLKREF